VVEVVGETICELKDVGIPEEGLVAAERGECVIGETGEEVVDNEEPCAG
jgi:uncharacterized protein YuzB (UPF0349 family)